MKAAVLPVVTFGLFAMVVADRVSHALAKATSEAAAPGQSEAQPPRVAAGDRQLPKDRVGTNGSAAASAPSNTPTIDRLARLAARQFLGREGGSTYLDSLIASTDSLIRRWPDRAGALKVCLIEGGTPGYRPQMAMFV